MRSAATPYRRDERSTIRVPVVMPLVEVAVDTHGCLTVTLDREPYAADQAFKRDDLQRLVQDIASDLETPVRVEVHEADGVRFTDIVTPQRRAPEAAPRATHRALASPFGISGGGFTAGEQVEVCIVVARRIADDDGSAQLRLPPALLAEHPNVVLVGRTSGAVALSEGTA